MQELLIQKKSPKTKINEEVVQSIQTCDTEYDTNSTLNLLIQGFYNSTSESITLFKLDRCNTISMIGRIMYIQIGMYNSV